MAGDGDDVPPQGAEGADAGEAKQSEGKKGRYRRDKPWVGPHPCQSLSSPPPPIKMLFLSACRPSRRRPGRRPERGRGRGLGRLWGRGPGSE